MLSIVRRQLPEFGTTYGPAGEGSYPAVVILHGSEGGNSGWSHRMAVMLAAHGFLAYPHSYSRGGNVWNAGAIRDVPLDRTAEALESMANVSYGNGKVGIYGVSRGGEHALLLASLMASEKQLRQPDAIAVHGAADVICGAFDAKSYRDSGDPGWKPWDPADRAWTWRGNSEALKPTTPIEIENYKGPLFLSHGVKDSVWSVNMCKRLESRLASREEYLETHYYEDEDHVCRSDAENVHLEQVLQFFSRFLSAEK